MLEGSNGVKVEWPADDDDGENTKMTDFFVNGKDEQEGDELATWFGTPVGLEAF
jgi:ribonuclease H2 subunit A